MIFWHLGGGVVLAKILFGRSLDFRLVALGALLPDLIDKPVGRIFLRQRFQSGRLFGHSMAGAFVIAAISRRNPRLRGLAAGVLTHLILDSIWRDGQVALWPLVGKFPRKPTVGAWWRAFVPGVSDLKLLEEVAGVVLLIHFWRQERLIGRSVLSAFVSDGRLPSISRS